MSSTEYEQIIDEVLRLPRGTEVPDHLRLRLHGCVQSDPEAARRFAELGILVEELVQPSADEVPQESVDRINTFIQESIVRGTPPMDAPVVEEGREEHGNRSPSRSGVPSETDSDAPVARGHAPLPFRHAKWLVGTALAAACIALFLLWPRPSTTVPGVRILAFKPAIGAAWESFRDMRAVPDGSSVRIAPMPVEDRHLLVFDGTDAPAVLPLEKLEAADWTIQLRGPQSASFLVLDRPSTAQGLDSPRRLAQFEADVAAVIHGHDMVDGTRLAWSDGRADLQRAESFLRGSDDPARQATKPQWAIKLETVFRSYGLKPSGYSFAVSPDS